MTNIRNYILGQKAKTKEITPKGWAMPIRIQELTVSRKLAFFQILRDNQVAIAAHETDPNQPAVKVIDEALLLLAFSVVDDNDNLVFGPQDLTELEQLPFKVVEAIYYQATVLGHLSSTFEEVEAEKKE